MNQGLSSLASGQMQSPRPPRARTRALILSSTEGLPIARAVQVELSEIECSCWDQDQFAGLLLSQVILRISEYPFLILVLTPDDAVLSRGHQSAAPRDNLILEIGMSMAINSVAGTFVLCPDSEGFKVPTDLAGLVLHRYRKREDGNWRAAVATACQQIAREIQAQTRDGLQMSAALFHRSLLDLNDRIRQHNPEPDIVVGVNQGGAIVGGLLYYLNRSFHFTVFWVGCASTLRTRTHRHTDFRAELEALVLQSRKEGDSQLAILLVDDTLRTGKAMAEALRVVREVAPEAAINIAVIVYRPDLAVHYDPAAISPLLLTPDPDRFAIRCYDAIFHEHRRLA